MFALSLGKNICHAYSKHIEIKTVTQHNIVYSQRKKLTICCKFLDIENSVSYNSDTMCGHGGIGRRVRLRGVWDDRVSSSLTGRTKDKQKLVFFLCQWDFVVLCTTHLWCRTHTPCIVTLRFLSKLNCSAISSLRSSQVHTGRTKKKNQVKRLGFFLQSVRFELTCP